MTVQITIRLPDDLVEFLDAAVREGQAPSRAALVSLALQRLARDLAAAQEVADMAARAGIAYPDLADVPTAVSRMAVDYDG
jgi:Arc/MetJ-type ribon-helix-helix transcriptional regulator